jgi:hypothetical protein
MRIDMDERLDKEYPERSRCQVNERDCSYRVDQMCHDCGTLMCEECSVGVSHQPKFWKYRFEGQNGTETTKRHCPQCLDAHTLNRRNVALSVGSVVLGLVLAAVGNTDTVVATVLGVVLILLGLLLGRYEYRLKARDNSNYGLSSMW